MKTLRIATTLAGFGIAHAAFATPQDALIAQGAEIFAESCFICHNATTPNPDMIAPPMLSAKGTYGSFETREAFVAAVSAFIFSPTEDKARMSEAVAEFGLMPTPMITQDEAVAVAEYIWDTDFSLPYWYEAAQQQ